MNRIRVLIADDEPIARRGVRQLLAAHDDVEIAGEARNEREAVRLLQEVAADLVFLDVQMPLLDGFAVLDALVEPKRVPLIIFLTAYDTFAVKAFEARALDYLVKPVNARRFNEALSRAREHLRGAQARHLVIGNRGSERVLEMNAAVHEGGRRHLVRESLDSLEARLDPARFVRAHRGAIVHLRFVAEIRSARLGESALMLRDGTRIALSRRRRRSVEEAIHQYAG